MHTKANARTLLPVKAAQVLNQWVRSSMAALTKRRVGVVAAAIGMGLAVAPVVSRAQAFDIKTGAWEVTTTTAIDGMLMPKETLEKMPPEQRAKFEQMMRARAAKPNTHTRTSCVTKEKLARSEVLQSEDPKCTRNVISQSARKLEVEETCPPPRATKSHYKFEAKSAESYVAVVDVAQSEGGKVHVDMAGHWLSAVCKKGVGE
jgi:hypothetical protein